MTNELALCQGFIDAHGEDAARTIEQLSPVEVAALLEALPPQTSARALDVMMPSLGADCVGRLAPQTAGAVLAGLRPGRAAVLLRYIDDGAKATILEHMPVDDARILRLVLAYPAGSAGALMDSRVFTARESQRVSHVLASLRRWRRPHHDYVFVVDDEHRLVGTAGVGDLVAARPVEALTGIMQRSVSRVPASAGRAAILNHPGWRRFHALPVVDEGSVLVGAISYEMLRALIEEAALGGPQRPDAASTIVALGELYWLGLSGVLDGVAAAVRRAAASVQEVPNGAR